MPGPQVVSSGDNATFTCSVISSPEESLLSWKLGSRILHRHDTRTRIVPAVTQEAGEIRTTSSLTIFRVTGFDSDVVECFSEYFVTGGIVLSTVRTKTILSVLGMYGIVHHSGSLKSTFDRAESKAKTPKNKGSFSSKMGLQ